MGSTTLILIIVGAVVALLLLTGLRTVNQGTVAVTTVFGKYRRTLRPGLNLLMQDFRWYIALTFAASQIGRASCRERV